MQQKVYGVTIPIAGHVYVEVEADDEDDAIEKAMESDFTSESIESWEALTTFTEGNVCYCPSHWKVYAELVGHSDSEDETESHK